MAQPARPSGVSITRCALIAPSLRKGEMPDATAASILRQRYPELSALEIHVLVTAAARVHAQRD